MRLHLGVGLRLVGRADAAVLDRAVALSREGGLPNNLARALAELGETALHHGDADGVERWFAECEQVARDLGNDTLPALVALGRGAVARLRDDPATARCATGKHSTWQATSRGASPVRWSASPPPTSTPGRRAVAVARTIGDQGIVAAVLEQLARLAMVDGDDAELARLLREAAAVRSRSGRPRTLLEDRDIQRSLTSA